MGGEGAVPEGGLVSENPKTRACSQAEQTPARSYKPRFPSLYCLLQTSFFPKFWKISIDTNSFNGPCSGIRPIELNDHGARFSAAEIASIAWN